MQSIYLVVDIVYTSPRSMVWVLGGFGCILLRRYPSLNNAHHITITLDGAPTIKSGHDSVEQLNPPPPAPRSIV